MAVSPPHVELRPPSSSPVRDLVARWVLGGPPPVGPRVAPGCGDVDVAGALVDAAAENARRLALASRLWLGAGDSAARLASILRAAVGLDVASSGAIGVASAMVGALASRDEEDVARTLGRARTVLADDDLISGSAALMLAIGREIAHSLALDPVVVEFELRVGDLAAPAGESGTPADVHIEHDAVRDPPRAP